MADILIKGMELPKTEKDSFLLVVKPNEVIYHYDGDEFKRYKVVEVPEHGRLIDADNFKHALIQARDSGKKNKSKEKIFNEALDILFEAPTVLEASK